MTIIKNPKKVPWYCALAFLFFWVMLFFGIVIPVFFHLPDGLRIQHESDNPRQFIAERAQRILVEFEKIGPKVVGSVQNENVTLQLLYNEVGKIQKHLLRDYFDLEIKVQKVSGAYMHWTMVNMYQGVQNFIVKLTPINNTNDNYVLINSHFDSKAGSPGAGDDGTMVVIMLEILRVLAVTPETFKHPIVFLFNGAEENPLQASHGFVTQHEWAKKCKALINLDSAGSGHREILFQSGPNHPWLMNTYRKNVKRPYATTMAEELFQANLIPSDTDFRIFKNFGQIPGLDLAHSYNGYIYHTAFDKQQVIPIGTLQASGENILALVRGLANAHELDNIEKFAEGHNVFYDFLGLFVIFYTEMTGKILNGLVCIISFILIFISSWKIASKSSITSMKFFKVFGKIFLLQLFAEFLGFALPILIAVIYDADNRSLTYFTNKWFVIGLYICPSLFGLSAPTLLYMSYSRNDKIGDPYRLQMILHSHCIILSTICFVTTFLGIRTSYLLMLAIFFYICYLLMTLVSTLHDKGYFWSVVLIISQIVPFLYFSYLIHALLCTLIPMMGRYGSATNPDILIGGLTGFGTVLAMGFIIPLLNIFKYCKSMLITLMFMTFIFCITSLTPLGFPYRPKTHVGRIDYMHVRRVFYEYDGSVSLNETGFYLDFQDRRKHHVIKDYLELSQMVSIEADCDKVLMCGLPIFNHRMYKSRNEARWLPTNKPLKLHYPPILNLLSKTIDRAKQTILYNFTVTGPPHMSIYISTRDGVKIIDWSFLKDMLEKPDEYKQPYHIYFSYGVDNSPLEFYLEFLKSDGLYNVPVFEIGIAGHYLSKEYFGNEDDREFVNKFPNYIYVMGWPSSYERYIF